MNLKNILIFTLLLLFFSACSSSGKQGSPERITNGLGLLYDFEIDTSYLPDIEYKLTLENDGDKTIVIKKSDFKFTSINRYQGQDIFTQDSLNKFKEEIFKDGDLEIPIQSSKEYNGNLRVLDEVYYIDDKNTLFESVEYSLKISYEYLTEFNNNIEINPKESEIEVSSTISQAAPVQLKDIDLTFSKGEPKLIFSIRDQGQGDSSVELKDIEIYLGTSSLSCQNYYSTSGSPQKIENINPILDSENDEVLVACDFNLDQYDQTTITTTKTYGSFEYFYTIGERKTISFPSERSSGFD